MTRKLTKKPAVSRGGAQRLLFVDPGSKSMGWALFDAGLLVDSGTITAKGKDSFERLRQMAENVDLVFMHYDFDEVHIETLNYQTHYVCIWSVGVIGAVLRSKAPVFQDVYITSWEKHAKWHQGTKDLWKERGYDSPDEFAAVCMGDWYLSARRED